MKAVRHVDFKKFKILTADGVKMVNLRHCTKFYVDRPNSYSYQDIVIFRLSR